MTLKSQIGNDLNSLTPQKLVEAYHYVSLLKKDSSHDPHFAWKKYVGLLSNVEAKRLIKQLDKEFENIEGEW